MLKKKLEKKIEVKEEIWVCDTCGGENIEHKSWTLLNKNNKFVEKTGDEEFFCQDCEEGDIKVSLKK